MIWKREAHASLEIYVARFGIWKCEVWTNDGDVGYWLWDIAPREPQHGSGRIESPNSYQTAVAAKSACTRFANKYLKGE